MRICSQCHTIAENDAAKFCKRCGGLLIDERRKKPWIVQAIIFTVILCLLTFGFQLIIFPWLFGTPDSMPIYNSISSLISQFIFIGGLLICGIKPSVFARIISTIILYIGYFNTRSGASPTEYQILCANFTVAILGISVFFVLWHFLPCLFGLPPLDTLSSNVVLPKTIVLAITVVVGSVVSIAMIPLLYSLIGIGGNSSSIFSVETVLPMLSSFAGGVLAILIAPCLVRPARIKRV